ncbi:MAG: hypothetical protein AAGF02_16905, partial [Actinomycetota bacterium]
VVLAGCSSSGSEDVAVDVDPASGTIAIRTDDGSVPATTDADDAVVVGSGGDADAAVAELPELADRVEPIAGEIDGDGVLVAAIVVATGDIEAALDEGVVTPAEVEAALVAIDEGSLSEWITE